MFLKNLTILTFVSVVLNLKLIKCELENSTKNAITTLYQPSEVDPSDNNGHIPGSVFFCGLDVKNGLPDHTWLARLKYDNDEYGCGGVLITSRYVLTAASCVSRDVVLKLGEVKSVALRKNNDDRDFVNYEIEKIVKHSKYDPNDLHGHKDVALIRLAKIVSRHTSTQICLDRYPIGERHDASYVEGWGQTLDGQTRPERELLKLQLIETNKCQERLPQSEYQLTEDVVCTAFEDIDTNQTCPVDGGGVLLRQARSKWFLIGIASFNTKCGTNEMPGLFTRITQIYDWINNNMNP